MSPSPARHPTSGIASLVLGILGLTVLPLVGSILAVVFGYQSRREAAAEPQLYTDELGRVGRILGWIGVAISGLVLVAVLLILGFVVLPLVTG